jgi:hypothetical protein
MSARRAIQWAMRDQLRSSWAPRVPTVIPASLVNSFIDAMFDGQPPPGFGGPPGSAFVAVHKGPRSNDCQNSLDERYGVKVTLTMRYSGPFDRTGQTALDALGNGLEDIADNLRAFVHMNYLQIFAAANTYIQLAATTAGLSSVYGFCEPLMFQGDDEPSFKGSEWFHGAPGASECGVAMTLRFGNMRLLQPLANMS